jgi:hypothetical protein
MEETLAKIAACFDLPTMIQATVHRSLQVVSRRWL